MKAIRLYFYSFAAISSKKERLLYTGLILLFYCAAIIQTGFLLLLRFRKKRFNNSPPFEHLRPVSIVVCARNESQNLQQFLPLVLEQDYPTHLFEVIVVNDQSTDDSAEILSRIAEKFSQLRVINIPVSEVKTLPGKKYALSKGIEAATFDRLLLTDADCKPATSQWLRLMTNDVALPSEQKPDVHLGYGAYEAHPGILNKFIRWETANTCMQYASYAAIGLPYMGVGRNLSYSKSLLEPLEKDASFEKIYTKT